MIVTNGADYQSAKTAKALVAADAKVGKTSAIIASMLGVAPWQKIGGVVDKPENLHVVTFDANAAGGVKKFLTETCKAPPEALGFTIYNMQDDIRKVSLSVTGWDFTFYNTVREVLDKIAQKASRGGVHVVHFSSLTGMAAGLLRAVAGPPGTQKGGGMDMSKWDAFSQQVSELRNLAQQDTWHCIWEAHILRTVRRGQGGEKEEESLQVPGKSGQNFAFNVEQVFRLRRLFGQTFTNTACDKFFLDTKPSGEFVANGRGFNEALAAQEPCMTTAFDKLGLQVGHWNAKAGTPAATTAAK